MLKKKQQYPKRPVGQQRRADHTNIHIIDIHKEKRGITWEGGKTPTAANNFPVLMGNADVRIQDPSSSDTKTQETFKQAPHPDIQQSAKNKRLF